MNVPALLEQIDDWINPIVIKELRQAVKSRMVVGILMLFLGVQLFLLGLFLLFRDMGDDTLIDWNLGNEVFRWQQGILLITLMLMVPAYAAVRLGAERSDHNVDLLFISTLHPRSIISGKLFAALVLAMLIYSTCAPFMTFTYLLRGIDIPTILMVLGIDLLFMLLSTMLALFLAAIPGPRAAKFFIAFLGFIFLGIICISMLIFTLAVVMEGTAEVAYLIDYGPVMSVTIAGILGLVGLFFVYAVTLISPVTSNRVLPIRLYLFALWLIIGGGLFATSYFHKPGPTLIPIFFWVLAAGIIISIQFCISICERERWGPRMQRSIPRSYLARPFAFLFWTGSAGGITLTTLLAVGTFVSAWWWCAEIDSSGLGDLEFVTGMISMMTILFLYTYCYGLTSLLVRTHVLAGQMKTSLTWLVALLLVGLGSSIPSVIAWFFFSDDMRHGSDNGWWMLPNPFMALYEFTPSSQGGANTDFLTLCNWFMGTWAVLVTLLGLPWYFDQVRRFHPPRKRDMEYAPVMVVETPASVAM